MPLNRPQETALRPEDRLYDTIRRNRHRLQLSRKCLYSLMMAAVDAYSVLAEQLMERGIMDNINIMARRIVRPLLMVLHP